MGIRHWPFLSNKTPSTHWPSTTPIERWTQTLRNRWLESRTTADSAQTAADPSQHPDFNLRECVAALDAMHRALERETAERQSLERVLRGMATSLAKTQARLASMQRGERLARHLAMHDELTTLPNRRHLLQHLQQLLGHRRAHSPGLTVVYIDLDKFKAVNDHHGHGVGDEVLRITAARLSAAVRQGDTVVRLGGDEFVCLLQDVAEPAVLRPLCAKLLDTLSAPMHIGALELQVHPSIGMAICPEHGTTASALLECADQAMYTAKRSGCGFAFHGHAAPKAA